MVPDPQYDVSSTADKLSSAFVPVQVVSMLRTIELDNEPRQKKSATNGPIGYCLRNLNPLSCRPRKCDHNLYSASV